MCISRSSLAFPYHYFPQMAGSDIMYFGISKQRCDLPDGVVGAQTDPLGDGAVLTLSFGKLLLGAEGLVALCGK
jgi:hypothetical protein